MSDDLKQNLLLTYNDTLIMRGIAIFFIVVHNLLHLILPVTENEFTYERVRYDMFIENALDQPQWVWADIFSFLGWYGVAVFIFLSGYGLSRKYEVRTNDHVPIASFIKSHWLKIVKLMIVPMILYAIVISIINKQIFSPSQLILQLSLLGNIVSPTMIEPGVFWFFGLIFQLYVIYRLLIFRRSPSVIIVVNALCLILLVLLCKLDQKSLLQYLMHNFVGWLLPFTIGVFFARYNVSILFNKFWKQVLCFTLCGGLVFLSNANIYSWLLSPILAVIASIALVKLLSTLCACKLIVYLGYKSSYIFALHPIIRRVFVSEIVRDKFSLLGYFYESGLYIYVFVYIVFIIVVAEIYSRLYNIK